MDEIKKLINKIIKEEIDEIFLWEEAELLPEGGYTKLLQSMAGLEPSINTLGIVTAENPMTQPLSPQENKLRNKKLAGDIRAKGYGFYPIKGKYGSTENPFVIPNIHYKDIVYFGKKYEQESVIFIKKQGSKGMTAYLLFTGQNEQNQQATQISQVVLPLSQNIEDFYSEYKGRKFVIPFFDDFFKNFELKNGKIQSK